MEELRGKTEKLLRREIPSSTGLRYRGRGLPGIYEAFVAGRIANLVIVSNDAFGRLSTEEFFQLRSQFEGTFVYWEETGT